MESKQNIWILEDDNGSRFVYNEILGVKYHLTFFSSMKDFNEKLERNAFQGTDLLIADLKLSDGSFLTYLQCLGNKNKITCPFLVVSSMDDVDSLLFCFKKGAVDYLTKPFARAELQVKVDKALIWKGGVPLESPFPETELDSTTLTILNSGKRSKVLTPKEFQILAILLEVKDPIARPFLTSRVWKDSSVSPKTFDVHLSNLRKKIAQTGLGIQFIAPNSYQITQAPDDVLLLCDGMN